MRVAVVSVVAAAAWLVFSCGVAAPSPEQPEQSAAPDGVPLEVRELVEAQGVTDQMISDAAEQDEDGCLWPPLPDGSCAVYAVTFVWGHLCGVRMPPFPLLDWSGGLSVSSPDASIRVIRTIDFEGEDLLLPAPDPASVAWESTTAGDFDGLGALIRVPTASPATAATADLTFKTPPLSITLPFAKLDRLIAYYPVSDTDGVVVLARRLDALAWPRGFIRGEWVPGPQDPSQGSLRGMWYNLFGAPVATMGGSFWTTAGGGALEGWLSGVWLTVVLAELEGTWQCDDPSLCATCGCEHGQFEGKYWYLNRKETGVLRGRFGDCAWTDRRIQLTGVWRADCPVAAEGSSVTSQ